MSGHKILFALIVCSATVSCLPVEDIEDKKVPINYNFKYSVDDKETGDHKSHHETMEGGVVKGFYTVQEADGSFREVHYTADKQHGFRAVVKNTSKSEKFHKHDFNNDEHVFYPFHPSIRHPCSFPE